MSYSFLDLAYEVPKSATQPMIYQEIWQVGEQIGLTRKLGTTGKTPWQSLGARLYVEVRDNNHSKFVKVGSRPTRFFLKENASDLPADAIVKLEKAENTKTEIKGEYHERDVHALLAYYANSNPSFNRGRSIYTKTIMHEKSIKGGYNEWIHPDMVGFYLPLDDWQKNVIDFNRLSDDNSLRLFSFEIKKGLSRGNYREAYFQAVSNSSWAHEGYLVAIHIKQDDEFLAELERLASSFGIGLYNLIPTILMRLGFFIPLEAGRRSIGKLLTSYVSKIRSSTSSYKMSKSPLSLNGFTDLNMMMFRKTLPSI